MVVQHFFPQDSINNISNSFQDNQLLLSAIYILRNIPVHFLSESLDLHEGFG
jgi:hypothetical protein